MKSKKYSSVRLIAPLLSFSACALATLSAQAQSDYYVSPIGNDLNSGTSVSSPFATIERARDEIRNASGGGTVYLLPGDYLVNSTINFDESDSGTSSSPITYKSYGSPGSARLVGGERVTGWTDANNDGIWQANVSWSFETLYAEGHRVPKARHPNVADYKSLYRASGDYLTIASSVTGYEDQKFNTNAGDFSQFSTTDLNADDIQIYVWPGAHDWANEIHGIAFESSSRIAMDEPVSAPYLGDLKAGSRYFVQGAEAFLDQAGEWYHDPVAGILYYMPVTTDPNNEVIYAPKVKSIISMSGSSASNTVENIIIDGLTIMVSDFDLASFNTVSIGGVFMKNVRDITIKNSRFQHLAGNGVAMQATNASLIADGVTIEGNYFFEIGHSGIRASGTPKTDTPTSKNHVIKNNRVSKIAEIATNGAGILLSNTAFTEIKNNIVHDAVHYGIEVKGTKHWIIRDLATPNSQGDLVMPDGTILDAHYGENSNVYNYNPGRYNSISFNEVYNVNLDTQDTGIYKSGGTYNTIVDHNILRDSGSNFGIQKGLYLDDVSDYTTITNNIVYGVNSPNPSSNALNVKGVGSDVINNVFHFNNTGARILEFEPAGKPQPTLRNTITNNIFYSSTSNVFYDFAAPSLYSKGLNSLGELALLDESNYNIFYSSITPHAGNVFKNIPGSDTLTEWRTITGLGGVNYDLNSRASPNWDPLFNDAANGDYTLQSGSPAPTQISFTEIDTSNIGLTTSHIFSESGHYTEFADDFEAGFSSWTVSFGSASSSTSQSYDGSSSYAVNEDQDQIRYNRLVSAPGKATVFFYDDTSETNDKISAFVADGNGGSISLGVSTSLSSTKYFSRIDGVDAATSVDRSTGWHKFTFDFLTEPGVGKVYIDDVLVGSTNSFSGFITLALGDNAANGKSGNFYFDAVTIEN